MVKDQEMYILEEPGKLRLADTFADDRLKKFSPPPTFPARPCPKLRL